MRRSLDAICSDIEENLSGILDALFDLSEEEDGLTTIDDTMIISEGDVHNWSSHDRASPYDGTDFGGMHTEDSALRHVHNRGTHH